MRALLKIVILIILFAMRFALPEIKAQEGCQARPTFVDRENFPVIRLSVAVLDESGNPIQNLSATDFQLFENDQAVIANLASDTGEPFTAMLVLDNSGSMFGEKIINLRQAARAFIESLRTNDEVGLIPFSGTVRAIPPTSELEELLDEINRLTGEDPGTAFYSAIVEATNAIQGLERRRFIIALTDGRDNSSAYRNIDAIQAANSEEIQVYTIGLGNNLEIDFPVLQDIARQTNADFFLAPDAAQLQNIYTGIFNQVANEYILEYSSPAPIRNGQERNIDITVTCPNGSAQNTGILYNPGGVFMVPELANAPMTFNVFLALLLLLLSGLFGPRILLRIFAPAKTKNVPNPSLLTEEEPSRIRMHVSRRPDKPPIQTMKKPPAK